MPRLELSLLGPFSASLDGRPLTRFRSDNARVLLAFLAMHDGERYQRHYLASLFWPDAPPADARTNLRQILYHLRRVLAVPDDGPPFLLADHNSIGFNRESDFQIDVAEFSALMGAVDSHAHHQSASCASCVQHLPAALALYRGDFLSGLPLPNSETFEAWRVVTQERLHLQVVAGIGTLVDHFQEQQDYARAIHYVSHLLTLEPWREEDHRRLMHLLALDGQASAAQAHYEACREILKFELGTEPCPATVDLADAIRTGRFTPAQDRSGVNETIVDVSDQALAASYLPKAERLFGRETELDRLDRWLRHERHQLVTILGMGGVGKTTLAAHVAHNIAAARPRSESGEESSDRGQVFDQVLWRSLVNAPPLSKVLAQWLQLFGNCEVQHHAESTHEQVDLLVACLSQQPTLLILDNLESILDEDAQTGQLQPGYEDYGYLLQAMAERDHCSCLLITSREEPHLLAGLERGKAGVSRLQLAGLSPSAGRQLFRRWSLCGHEKALDMLCDRYSGSPLALELVSETIDELYGGDVQSFLALPFAVFEDIEDVLNQQFERLTALEQSLLYWLAVEREPRSIKELGDNLLGDASPDSVPVAMRRLLRRSLVEKQESDEGTRFYLQNVITEFMTDRLVRNICQEIIAGRVGILNSHALLKATTEAYVVESQQRMIVQPVVSRMKAHFGVGELRRQLQQMVVGLQAPDGPGRGYAAGNLLNLMLSAGLDVQHMDFSGLTLRQVNLQDAVMPHVNLAGVTFRDCSFADTFASLFSLAVSPDGTLLAATTALGSVRIWRRSDGSQVARIPIQPGYLWSVAFGPDGRYLATAGDDARIYLYRVGGEQGDISLTLERVLIGHEGTVRSVCFNPDGTELASGGVDGTVRHWPLATTVEAYPAAAELKGDQHTILFGHTDRVFRVVYSPDGRILASAGADTEIRVWDRTTGASVWTLRGHDERIAALAFAPDGQILASGSVDTQVRLWHMAKGDCVKVLSRHSEPLLAVAFSPDGRYLASAGHGTSITLWETHGWQPIRQFQADAHDGPRIWGLSFSPDSRELISAGAQISMQVWDLPTSLCRLRLHPWHVAHAAVAFHPSGRWIITGSSDGRLRVWDADRAEANLPAVTQSTADSILATALDPQGRQLVTGLSTGLIQVWKVTSGHERVELKLIQEIGDIRNSITQLRYSPDGQTLAACSQQGGFHLWRVSDRPVAPLTSVRHVSAHRHEALALAIHPQGHQAASGGDDRVVRLWDVRTGTGVGTIEVAKSRINSIEYGPDGSMLLVGCADGTIALVQVDARTLFGRFLAHETGTRVVRFAGLHTCVSAGVDGSLAVWRLQGDGTQTCQQRLAGHAGLVFDLQLHPRRPLFVSVGRDSTVRLWDLRAGECLAMWRTPGPYWGTSIDGAWGLTAVEKSNLLALGMVNGNVEDERLTDGINVQPLSVMSKVRPSSGVWLPSNDAIPEWGSTALPERVVRPGLASTAPMA